jgi:hypothetical protein
VTKPTKHKSLVGELEFCNDVKKDSVISERFYLADEVLFQDLEK